MAGRIQRSRAKGWRLPADAVSVTRPGRWGNPYAVGEFDRAEALSRFEQYARQRLSEEPDWLAPLSGKRLACWCRPEQACHADILARLLEES